jgi:topoisomerase-4 subunit A
VIYNDGHYEITTQELTQKYESEKVLLIEKFNPEKIISAVYLDKKNLQYNVSVSKLKLLRWEQVFLYQRGRELPGGCVNRE